jgi:hypothetical protein
VAEDSDDQVCPGGEVTVDRAHPDAASSRVCSLRRASARLRVAEGAGGSVLPGIAPSLQHRRLQNGTLFRIVGGASFRPF